MRLIIALIAALLFPSLLTNYRPLMVAAVKTANSKDPDTSQLQVGSSGVKKSKKARSRNKVKARKSAPGIINDNRVCYRLSFNLHKLLTIGTRESCLAKCEAALVPLYTTWANTVRKDVRRKSCIRSKDICLRSRFASLTACDANTPAANCPPVLSCKCSTQVTIFRIWQPLNANWLLPDAPKYQCSADRITEQVMKKLPPLWIKDKEKGTTVIPNLSCVAVDDFERDCPCARQSEAPNEESSFVGHAVCVARGSDKIPEEPLPDLNDPLDVDEFYRPECEGFGLNDIPAEDAGPGEDPVPGELPCGII